MSASKASRFRSRLSINPDEPPTSRLRSEGSVGAPVTAPNEAPGAEAEPLEPPALAVEATPSEPDLPPPGPKSIRKEQISALDDPTIVIGRRDYRSFYVEDTAFARFRAAIYWLSRREDADDVPENMSVAIEDFMTMTAEDLEKRYNDGQLFRMPPGTRRRRSPARS